MKKLLYDLTICLGLLCLCLAGCTSARETPGTPTVKPFAPSSPTKAAPSLPVPTSTATPTETMQPTRTSTPTPFQIVFPAVTMSPQEVEAGLLELLRTNGNCTGKCIGGIRPDEMTVQDAVNTMTQWGAVRIGEDVLGRTFINLDQNILYERVGVYLSVGTWTEKLETIDHVSLRIQGVSGPYFVGDDLWLANRDAWWGVRLDNLLIAYGVPSYVGYEFATTDDRLSSLEGRTIAYTMEMQYEQINLVVGIGALAYYDGENLFLCPSQDPHDLGIKINPERPLEKLQEFYPVTWQALTGTDLEAFYQKFTDEADLDACITTTLKQIQALQPDFR